MKLIVDVPDKILRFISGSPETFGETESLGEVRGKAEAGAGTGGEAFKGAGGKAGDTMGATSGAVQKAKGEDQIAATKDKALSGDNTGGLTRLAGTGKEGKGGAEVPPPAGKEKPPEGGAGGAGGGGPGAPGGP